MSTPSRRYVLCVHAEIDGDLEVRKLYEVRPDGSAATQGYLRVVDESGEDYLYPADWFVALELPDAARRALRGTPVRGAGTRAKKPPERRERSAVRR